MSSSSNSKDKVAADLDDLQNLFYTIKVKRQWYLGKPAIAIYFSDVTKKVHAKL